MRPNESESARCDPSALSEILSACGFNARLYKGGRIYISGYGKDIKACLVAGPISGPLPADGYALSVSSSWRAAQYNGLRCKGVKHAILEDLYAARLISMAPPARWQDVSLDAPHARRPAILPYRAPTEDIEVSNSDIPDRHTRDPYAALRSMHHKNTSA
jgi:hypothetical protein